MLPSLAERLLEYQHVKFLSVGDLPPLWPRHKEDLGFNDERYLEVWTPSTLAAFSEEYPPNCASKWIVSKNAQCGFVLMCGKGKDDELRVNGASTKEVLATVSKMYEEKKSKFEKMVKEVLCPLGAEEECVVFQSQHITRYDDLTETGLARDTMVVGITDEHVVAFWTVYWRCYG